LLLRKNQENGDINWLCPSLGIPNYKLINLFSILEGDTAQDSPQTLTPDAENELQFFESQLQTAFLTRFDLLKPISLIIFPSPSNITFTVCLVIFCIRYSCLQQQLKSYKTSEATVTLGLLCLKK
jgi:hypothetical protein